MKLKKKGKLQQKVDKEQTPYDVRQKSRKKSERLYTGLI